MKRTTENGSALLVVLTVMSLMLVYSAHVWRSSCFLRDVAYEQQRYEQRFRATEAMLHWAIAFVRENFDQLVERSKEGTKEFTINFDKLAKNKGAVVLSVQKANIEIKAQLFDDEHSCFIVSCAIARDGEESLNVRDWKIG